MQKIKSTRSPIELVVQICGPDFCHYVSSQCKFLLSYCKACQVSTNTFLPFTFCLRYFLRSLLHFCLSQTTHKQALQISVFLFLFLRISDSKTPTFWCSSNNSRRNPFGMEIWGIVRGPFLCWAVSCLGYSFWCFADESEWVSEWVYLLGVVAVQTTLSSGIGDMLK